MINGSTEVVGFLIGSAAVVVYILFGGNATSKRKTKKQNRSVVGLENVGNSCFLNALVQSLACCPSVCEWIFKMSTKSESLTLLTSLKNMLKVVNGDTDDERTSKHAKDVFAALQTHGWVISREEQDAHELFHAITSTLEEEVTTLSQVKSLVDLSWLNFGDMSSSSNFNPIDVISSNVDSISSLSSNGCRNLLEGRIKTCSSIDSSMSNTSECSFKSIPENGVAEKVQYFANSFDASPISNSPISSSIEKMPFKGFLANLLQCKCCNHKKAGQLSSFDSLSLFLPSEVHQPTSLPTLIDAFISPEVVTDVKCEECSRREGQTKTSSFFKQLTISKLPQCICFHIQRTVWLSDGAASKRNEHVMFPLFFDMFPYTYISSLYNKSDYLQCNNNENNLENFPYSLSKQNSLYKLFAVIVHVGDVFSGHFITYRRGAKNFREKWFLCSDLMVEEVSFFDVQQANAYMIFYEKYFDSVNS